MKKKIIFGSILAILLIATVPFSSAIEYNQTTNGNNTCTSGEVQHKEIKQSSTYSDVELPIHYTDWKFMMATWIVPVEQIETFLPEKLKPVLFSPGKALISFGTLQYPNVSSIEPYDEFLISIPVQYDPIINIPFLPMIWNPFFVNDVIYKKGASWIVHLPVTTEESCAVGKEIWGFPKVVRKMEFSEDEHWKKCILIDGEEEVLTLEIKKHRVSILRKDFEYASFTEKDGLLLRTIISANGNYGIKILFGTKAKLTFGKGDIADQMKQLDLSVNPVQTFFAENIESYLDEADESFPK